MNYFKVTPSYSYSETKTNAIADVSSERNGNIDAAYSAVLRGTLYSPNYSLTALYNHRFKKPGRNFSININVGSGSTQQYQNPVLSYAKGIPGVPINQQVNTNSRNTSYGVTLSYLEPLATYTYLEFNYALSYSLTNNNKQTDVLDTAGHFYTRDSALSNAYNYTFITNRIGINYRFVKKKFNYTLGVSAEPAVLNGVSPLTNAHTHQAVFNVAPTAHFVFNFNRSRVFSLNYNGYSSQPSFTQLQPVTDFTNALYPVQGNPNLKPQFTNSFSARYNQFNFETGNTFFSNISFSQTQNQIVANTIAYPRKYAPNPALQNTYLTKYVNADGFYTASGFISYAIPWQKRRYTLMLNATATYTNNIGYLATVDSITYAQTTEKNIARNIMLTPGMRFRIDLPDIIDAQVLTNYSISKTNNSVLNNFTQIASNIRTWNIGLSGKNYIKKNWTISYEYNKIINYGYTVPVSNPNILNMYVERRFLKNGMATIRLAGFDLFNQNTGYSSIVTASSITQTTANRLGRYYLLTFTLRLQKFAGKQM